MSFYHCVVIEWDGEKPPTTFYNRLRSLGLMAGRGSDKTDSPITRRAKMADDAAAKRAKLTRDALRLGDNSGDSFGSVVVQEGMIMSTSEQLAIAVSNYATELGAKAVMRLNATVATQSLTTADTRVMEKLEAKLGKRGRPAVSQVIEWTVTCLEEARTVILQTDKIVTCPHCHSPRIESMPGAVQPVKVDPAWGLFETWKRTRFTRGRFEIAPIDPGATLTAPDTQIDDSGQALTVKLIGSSGGLIRDCEALTKAMNFDIALHCLDLVFLARTYTSADSRRYGRVQAVSELFSRGVSPTEASIVESGTNFDLLDAAYADPAQTAGFWMMARHERKNSA